MYFLKYQKRQFYNFTLFCFLLFIPTVTNCQSIEFQITDCLAYIDDEISLEYTREMRKNCPDGEVVLAFYPDTEFIEMQIFAKDIGSKYELLKMEPTSSNTYQAITPDSAPVTIDLKLNKLFGYIRGGKVNISGFEEKDGIAEVIVKFERN